MPAVTAPTYRPRTRAAAARSVDVERAAELDQRDHWTRRAAAAALDHLTEIAASVLSPEESERVRIRLAPGPDGPEVRIVGPVELVDRIEAELAREESTGAGASCSAIVDSDHSVGGPASPPEPFVGPDPSGPDVHADSSARTGVSQIERTSGISRAAGPSGPG